MSEAVMPVSMFSCMSWNASTNRSRLDLSAYAPNCDSPAPTIETCRASRRGRVVAMLRQLLMGKCDGSSYTKHPWVCQSSAQVARHVWSQRSHNACWGGRRGYQNQERCSFEVHVVEFGVGFLHVDYPFGEADTHRRRNHEIPSQHYENEEDEHHGDYRGNEYCYAERVQQTSLNARHPRFGPVVGCAA